MALYGLRVKDANGDITLDLTDRITRLRYSVEVDADTNGSVDLPDIDGLSSVEISVGLEDDWNKVSHAVSRSGTTISWTHQNDPANDYYPTNSLIFIFLYT